MKQLNTCWKNLRRTAQVALLGLTTLNAVAATRTWDGGGANENWSTPANWSANTAPVTGDTVVFNTAVGKTTNDLAADLVFNLRLESGGNYLYGNRIKLNSLYTFNTDLTAADPRTAASNVLHLAVSLNQNTLHYCTSDYGQNCWLNGNVDLNGFTLTSSNVNDSASFYAGQITNSGNIIVTGDSEAKFIGTLANTYSGNTTVKSGGLRLGKRIFNGGLGIFLGVTSVPGALFVGDNVGTNSFALGNYTGGGATVALDWNSQLATINAFVNRDGWLNLNNFNDGIGGLYLTNGAVATGSGTLTISTNVNVSPNSTNSVLTGELAWGSGTNHWLDVPTDLTFKPTALISGSGDWHKTGNGTLHLSVSNTFSGDVTINGGDIVVTHAAALGNTSGVTTIDYGHVLVLSNGITVVNETLQMAGAATLVGYLGMTWNGPIVLQPGYTGFHSHYLDGKMTLSGAISGFGDFQTLNNSEVEFSGPAANTYSGTTYVDRGVLSLNKSPNVIAVPGPLSIGTAGGPQESKQVILLQNGQISPTSLVTLRFDALLDLNGHTNTIGGLALYAGHINTGTGLLTLGGDLNVHSPDPQPTQAIIKGKLALGSNQRVINVNDYGTYDYLDLNANIISGGFIKGGIGTLNLKGTNTYAGVTSITNGVVKASTSQALGSSAGETYVSYTGALRLDSVIITNEPLNLDGTGNGTYPALDTIGETEWRGPIFLVSQSTFGGTTSNDRLTVKGDISGNPGAGITKLNGSHLILANTVNNTYDGLTAVNGGSLKLQTAPGIVAIPGKVQVTSGALIGSGTIQGGSSSLQLNNGTIYVGEYFGSATGAVIQAQGFVSTNLNTLFLDVGTTNNHCDSLVVSGMQLTGTFLFVNDWHADSIAPGTSYMIVSNTGPSAINGTFSGMPEGTLITNASYVLRLSYIGGDGNDITLTRYVPGVAAATNLNLTAQGGGVFQFSATGQSGSTYQLQTSTNLTAWTNLQQLIGGSGGSLQVNLTNSPAEPIRFYRLQSL